MKTFSVNAIEVLLSIGLIYGILKYWHWKLKEKFGIESSNRSYALFLTTQTMMIMIMLVNGFDLQNHGYIENLTVSGIGSLSLWSALGIQAFGVAFLFVFSNLVGVLLFKVAFPATRGISEEIKENNVGATLVAATIIFAIGYSSSFFVLRPFILEWFSTNAGLILLN